MNLNRVEVFPNVWETIQRLPPSPRKKLRAALRGLRHEKGDIKPLEGTLSGYFRLRVGAYRVIFVIRMLEGQRTYSCMYCGHRSVVYAVLEAKDNLRGFLE